MHLKLFLLLGVLVTLTTWRATAEVDDTRPVTSRISEVTVYADRAQVIRTGTVELPADTARFAFAELPRWIDEGSVRVSLVPAGSGQILDVQVQRTFLARASDEEFRKAEAAVLEISDQLAALDDEKAGLDASRKHNLVCLARCSAGRDRS